MVSWNVMHIHGRGGSRWDSTGLSPPCFTECHFLHLLMIENGPKFHCPLYCDNKALRNWESLLPDFPSSLKRGISPHILLQYLLHDIDLMVCCKVLMDYDGGYGPLTTTCGQFILYHQVHIFLANELRRVSFVTGFGGKIEVMLNKTCI